MIENKEDKSEFTFQNKYSANHSALLSSDWQEENTYDYDDILSTDNNEYLICDERKQSE